MGTVERPGGNSSLCNREGINIVQKSKKNGNKYFSRAVFPHGAGVKKGGGRQETGERERQKTVRQFLPRRTRRIAKKGEKHLITGLFI